MPAYFNDDLHALLYKLSKAVGQAQAGPVYDPAAEAYFAAVQAGSGTVISDSEKQNISNYIVAEKAQGRWTGVKEYYLLRSSQNAGTGTVVYGLKGLYNGVFVNSPTWGTDGITFNASQWISVTNTFSPSTNAYLQACYTRATVTQRLLLQIADTGGMGLSINRNVTDGNDNPGEIGSVINSSANGVRKTGTTLTGTHFIQSVIKNPLSTGLINLDGVDQGNVALGTYAIQNNTGNTRIGIGTFGSFDSVQMQFAAIGDLDVSITSMQQSYTNYKTNLGQGLPLP